jgi:dihydrofolate reductase
MTISLIAAASENNVIGKDGTLPWHLPNDLKRFRSLTTGHPIIMGRRTFESIGHPLPQRHNIVVTHRRDLALPECEVVGSLEDAIASAKRDKSEEIFIIGGGTLYKEALPFADRIHLTRVHATVDGDTFFPELPETEWREAEREPHEADDEHVYAYTFLTYERIR